MGQSTSKVSFPSIDFKAEVIETDKSVYEANQELLSKQEKYVKEISEYSPKDKEIRAAKSLIKQAQDRNDEKSEKTFTDWLNVLERTKDGESFAVINDENKANVLRQIEGTIKTKGLNKEEAQKFVYNMVSRKMNEYGLALNSKSGIYELSRGFSFLGYTYKLSNKIVYKG